MNAKSLVLAVMFVALLSSSLLALSAPSRPEQPVKRLFPPSSPPAEIIDLVNLVGESSDTKLALITLQGHINAGAESSVCFKVWGEEYNNTPTVFWLDQFKQKGYIEDYRETSIDDLLAKYGTAYEKVIIYDPCLPATINIATMIGSLEKGIVVAPRDVARFARGKETIDLRGKWSTNIPAYQWALDNLWDRMNHRILSCQHPTFANHHLRDYLIRHKVFQFWVTGKNVEDDASDYETELAFARKLLALTPPNTPMIGWLGADDSDHGLTEYYGVGVAGEYGKVTVGSNWGVNLTMVSGIDVDIPAMVERYQNKLSQCPPELQNDKVYLSFVIQESGDSPPYWQCVQKNIWSDPARGKVPVGWALGFPVYEMCPPILEWFYDQATANDHFYLAISGTGYAHPYRNFLTQTPNPEAAWKEYLANIQSYLNLTKMRQMGLYTDAWVPFDRSKQDPITLKFADTLDGLDMLIMGMGRDENIMQQGHNYLLGRNKMLVSHVVTRWDAANIGHNDANNDWLVDEIRRHTPPERPAFIMVHPLSWSYWPSDMLDVLNRLGSDYVAVSPTDFHTLYSNQ